MLLYNFLSMKSSNSICFVVLYKFLSAKDSSKLPLGAFLV